MPVYVYRCADCEDQTEVMQRMSDDPLIECAACGGTIARVLFAPAIHFKGSGFHNTDYVSKKRPGSGDGDGSAKSNGGSGDGAASSNGDGGGGGGGETTTPAATTEKASSSKTVGLDKV